jgi:glycosyltransferase involved in cell wall biosynthesis
MLISVVIPTHNDASYLAESVGSALAETWHGDIEVVVVDDGSDPPASETYVPNDSRVRMERQDASGVSAARNTGIRLAHGEYIAFLDADDAMLPGRLAAQAALLDAHPEVGLVGGDVTRRDQAGEELSWGIFEAFGAEIPCRPADAPSSAKEPTHHVFDESFRDLLLEHIPFNTSVIMARREALTGPEGRDAPFDPDLICWEDWDLVTRLARHWRIGYVRQPVILYRKRPGSITASPNPRKFESRAGMFERWGRDFSGLSPRQHAALTAARAESLRTASWEWRRDSYSLGVACAFRAVRTEFSHRSLRCLFGALTGRS